MKRVWIAFFGIIFILNFLSAERIHRNVKESVIRMHIVANSNSEEDQALKLKVRDFVLEKYGNILSEQDRKTAMETISANLRQMEADIGQKFNVRVKAELAQTDFPTKRYDSVRLPAGQYTALNIKIGKAQGKNWWCVMYPPLCFSELSTETDKAKMKEVLADAEYELVTSDKKETVYKFKAIELWNKFKKLF